MRLSRPARTVLGRHHRADPGGHLPAARWSCSSTRSAPARASPGRRPGFTLEWWGRAFQSEGALEAVLTSVQVAVAATAVSLVLGTLISLALQRFDFFGRDAVSLLVILPIALPGIITGIALNNAFRTIVGVQLSICHGRSSPTPPSASSPSSTT